jgi:hypothetical protein
MPRTKQKANTPAKGEGKGPAEAEAPRLNRYERSAKILIIEGENMEIELRAPLPRLRSSLLLMCYGPEFISRELDLWAFMHGVTLDFNRPGKPNGQRLRRKLERQVPGGVPERQLVPQPRRGAANMRGLA